MPLLRASARAGAVAALLLSPLCAGAAAADPLTLRAAIAAALRGNPELQGFAFDLKAQDARAAQAALTPAPELGFTAENFAGTGAVRGFTATEFTLSLSQAIELGDKRRKRIEVADAERRVIEADRQAQQLDLVAQVVRQFITVAADQERQQLAGETLALAEATRRAVDQRVQAARSPLAEGSRARIAVARAELERAQAARALEADRQALAALCGEPEAAFETVAADLYTLPDVVPFEVLSARLERNPMLARFVSEARLRDAEVRLALGTTRPDLTLGAGVRRLQAGRDEALVFSASVPLRFGANAGESFVREAQVQRDRVELDRQAARLRVHSELFGLYRQLQQARAELESLGSTVLPQAEAALKQTEYAWQRGRYSYLEWVDAQRELLTLRVQKIEAAASFHRTLAEIERLTGEPLAARADDGAVP